MARRVGGSVVPLVAAMLLGFATLVVGSLMTGGHEAGASFPSCGTVILSGSSWLGGNGVNVYSNGGDEGTGVSCGGTSTVNGVTAGSEWQCVELVNRLYLTRGWISSTWSGDGDTLYANAPGNLTKQPNGSVSDLGPGDVLSINVDDNGSPLDGGHALIVNDSSDVSSGTVQLVSENGASNQSPTASATISNGTVTIPSSGGYSYPVIGVIHAPGAGGGGPMNKLSVAAVLQSDGNQNVYYVGANGQLFNWYFSSTGWSNVQLGSGEAAAAGSGVAAVLQSDGNQNVYYVGANGQLFNWYFSSTGWSNAQLGSGEGRGSRFGRRRGAPERR